MKLAYLSRDLSKPASKFYYEALALSLEILLNPELDESFDFIFVPSYPDDLELILKAKRRAPKAKIGIIDPRSSSLSHFFQEAHFFVVDSLEMEDYFRCWNIPIIRYYEFPKFIANRKVHSAKEKIILGYHGNKLHLTSFQTSIRWALEHLGLEYELELWVIYNIKNLGKWSVGVPNNIKVKHIQWSETIYNEVLPRIDIGLSPNLVPIPTFAQVLSTLTSKRFFNKSNDDYYTSFKMPSNRGRIIVFQAYGIPVVSDFIPSACEAIAHGKTGYLAHSVEGWYWCLKQLIESADLREKFSIDGYKKYMEEYSFDAQNRTLLEELETLSKMTLNSRKLEVNKGGILDRLALHVVGVIEKYKKIKR